VKIKDIIATKAEAERFIKRCDDVEERLEQNGIDFLYGCKETGALRRSSLDLTRSLADLRRRPKHIF
jgi:hypothetical protein